MTNELPIDIHSSKLLDWLVSRRHCNKDWQKNILTIREKIKHAIMDMPESNEVVELLQGSYINYFHCIKIIKILQETEKDTKNFLGFYSSQRMKDWQEIESLYKKDNVYLAEAAQILQRLVQYEIPALRRQIAKNDQIVTDAAKKITDYEKQSEDSKKLYEKKLAKMALKGNSLRAELFELAGDLPTFFEQVVKEIQKLSSAREYYRLFREFMQQGKAPKSTFLPALTLLLKHGTNVTTYEWKYEQKPDKIEIPNFDFLLKANETNKDENEIDFGNEDIDFGDGEIDFGGDSVNGEIEFESDVHIDVVADDSGAVGEKIASGQDALNLLENSEAQKVVKEEINELLAFLHMRNEDETRETAADVLIRGTEKRPDEISNVNDKIIEEWIQIGNHVLSELANPQKVHLFKIRGSPQYVEQVVEELEKSRDMEGRYKRLQKLSVEKQKTAQEDYAKAVEEFKKVVETTRQLQKQVEGDVSQKYNGRPVNLMGGINQALAGL